MSEQFVSQVRKTYPTSDAELALRDLSATHKTLIRADIDSLTAADLGASFGQSRTADGVFIAGSRPGEWLLFGLSDQVSSVLSSVDDSGHCSVIDFTHGRALFRLTGAASAGVLEKLCSIDWADAMMPDGAVVSASVAKVGCDIVRQDEAGVRSYLILSDRSSAQYLFDAILDAGAEFNMAVQAAGAWSS